MKNKHWWIAVLGMFAMALSGVGFSAFTYAQDSFGFTSTMEPVCYIKGSSNVYYPSVESAIRAGSENSGSDTIYVIPGANPTMYKSATLAAGDTLILPYDGETYEDTGRTSTNSSFADAAPKDGISDPTLLTSRLTLAPNVALTVSGGASLIVGGMLGTGPQQPSGHVVGNYAEILMSANAKIENYGIFNLFGFVKTTANDNGAAIHEYNGSNVYVPLVLYDFAGGTYTSKAQGADIMPFTQFDIPNIQVLHRIDYGSRLNGYVTFQASGTIFKNTPIVVGTESDSCLFSLSDGYLSMHYRPINVKYFTKDVGPSITSLSQVNRTEVRISGNVALKSLIVSFSVYGIKYIVDTAKMDCSFCHKFDIHVDSGTTTLNYRLKFLRGSSVTIHEGATIVFNNRVSFYRNYSNQFTYSPGVSTHLLAVPSTLTVMGVARINSSFGGLILARSNSGRVITGPGFVDNNETIDGDYDANAGSLITRPNIESAVINKISRTFVSSSDNQYTLSSLGEGSPVASTTYFSSSINAENFGWYSSADTTYGIRYVLNNVSAANPNSSITSFSLGSGNLSLQPLSSSDSSKQFAGFFYDSSFSNALSSSDGGLSYTFTPSVAMLIAEENGANYVNVYGSWVDAELGKYTVTINNLYKNESGAAVTSSTSNDFTVGTSFALKSTVASFFTYTAGSGAAGSISEYSFSGYSVVVKDVSNKEIASFTVDSQGYSKGYVKDWIFTDTTSFKDGYSVVATAIQPKNDVSFSFSLKTSGSTLGKGKSGTATASISQTGSSSSLSFGYVWGVDNANALSITAFSGNQATYTNVASITAKTGKVTCSVQVKYDGEIIAALPSMSSGGIYCSVLF